jgi:hypothetical protein
MMEPKSILKHRIQRSSVFRRKAAEKEKERMEKTLEINHLKENIHEKDKAETYFDVNLK